MRKSSTVREHGVRRLFPAYQPCPIQVAPPPPSFRPARPSPPTPSFRPARPPPPPRPRPASRSTFRPSSPRPTPRAPSQPPSSSRPTPPPRSSPPRKSTTMRPPSSSHPSMSWEDPPPLSPRSGKPLDPLFSTPPPFVPFRVPYLALPAPPIIPDPIQVQPQPTVPPQSPSPPTLVPSQNPVDESIPISASTDATNNQPAASVAGKAEIDHPAASSLTAGEPKIYQPKTTLPPHTTPPVSPLAGTTHLSPETESMFFEHPATHTPSSTSSYVPSEATTPTSSSIPSAHTPSSPEPVASVSTIHSPTQPAAAGINLNPPYRDTDQDNFPLSSSDLKGKKKNSSRTPF